MTTLYSHNLDIAQNIDQLIHSTIDNTNTHTTATTNNDANNNNSNTSSIARNSVVHENSNGSLDG